MKIVDISWAAFWIGLSIFLSAWIVSSNLSTKKDTDNFYRNSPAEMKCAQNNGVPIYDTWGTMADCKIYVTPTKSKAK